MMLLVGAGLAVGQSAPDVVEFVRSAAEALSLGNASAFLDKLDQDMPEYPKLRGEIEALTASGDVGSAIEIVSDEGDDRGRSLELDWLLEVRDQKARRGIVKCRIERRGKRWKITRLEPVEFFKD